MVISRESLMTGGTFVPSPQTREKVSQVIWQPVEKLAPPRSYSFSCSCSCSVFRGGSLESRSRSTRKSKISPVFQQAARCVSGIGAARGISSIGRAFSWPLLPLVHPGKTLMLRCPIASNIKEKTPSTRVTYFTVSQMFFAMRSARRPRAALLSNGSRCTSRRQ